MLPLLLQDSFLTIKMKSTERQKQTIDGKWNYISFGQRFSFSKKGMIGSVVPGFSVSVRCRLAQIGLFRFGAWLFLLEPPRYGTVTLIRKIPTHNTLMTFKRQQGDQRPPWNNALILVRERASKQYSRDWLRDDVLVAFDKGNYSIDIRTSKQTSIDSSRLWQWL
jgi:hypothetical protein